MADNVELVLERETDILSLDYLYICLSGCDGLGYNKQRHLSPLFLFYFMNPEENLKKYLHLISVVSDFAGVCSVSIVLC
jgi:hypothetical protein